ncbi:hypothetical protein ACFP2T_25080 [Plantactinospora solaniradicis]|uniref:Uncharacterized protein n=1 Tax=Plantactinospora solaniradicis TaxID=1723736 RepID=A0ABW1KCW7_9ACTN
MTDQHNASGTVRRSRRALVVGAVAALCVLGLVWAGLVLLGDDREIRLEATTRSGEATSISWSGPDDNGKGHDVGDGPMSVVKTPWSKDIEVAVESGRISLNVIAVLGDTATCRLLVGDRVVVEETGRPAAHCLVSVERAFPVN